MPPRQTPATHGPMPRPGLLSLLPWQLPSLVGQVYGCGSSPRLHTWFLRDVFCCSTGLEDCTPCWGTQKGGLSFCHWNWWGCNTWPRIVWTACGQLYLHIDWAHACDWLFGLKSDLFVAVRISSSHFLGSFVLLQQCFFSWCGSLESLILFAESSSSCTEACGLLDKKPTSLRWKLCLLLGGAFCCRDLASLLLWQRALQLRLLPFWPLVPPNALKPMVLFSVSTVWSTWLGSLCYRKHMNFCGRLLSHLPSHGFDALEWFAGAPAFRLRPRRMKDSERHVGLLGKISTLMIVNEV